MDAAFELDVEVAQTDEAAAARRALLRAETYQFSSDVRLVTRAVLRRFFDAEGLREVPELPPGRRTTASLLWANAVPSPNMWPATTETDRRVRKVNHLPRTMGIHLTHKRYLYNNLAQARLRDPATYDFLPEAFMLPLPANELNALFDALGPDDAPFVQKPVNASRGDGISLVASAAQVRNTQQFLLQRCLDRVDLINGRKYHLRLFLLVTAVEPLRAYVHADGYVKLARTEYSRPTRRADLSIDVTYDMHVTNHRDGNVYDADPYLHTDDFYALLAARNVNVSALKQRIAFILARTLDAAASGMCQSRPRGDIMQNTFELFGVDILFDDRMRPWLMEVNLSPSLDVEASPVLAKVKPVVLRDTIRLAVTQPATPDAELQHGAAAELQNIGGFTALSF